ncbi:MAG: amidohydrolase family protein [Pseudomonadota bacterium]
MNSRDVNRVWGVTVGLLVTVFAACSNDPQTPAGTAITNVTVIDAANGVRERQTVVFDGDRIVAVQSADDAVAVAETLDGTGKYLLPGLWDMHVHLTYDDAFTDAMPALFLAHGVTSVRDTGGLMHKVQPVVDAMRAPDAVAPRVYYSGPLLDGRYVVYDGESRPEIGARNADIDMARANVQALKAAGVDFIKVYEMVSPAVFDALVSAGQENGLPVAAHVPLSMVASQAGPRVDSMEHLRNVELDCTVSAPELHEERLSVLANHDGGPGFELRSSLHALQRLRAISDYDPERCARTIDNLRGTIQVPTLRLNTFAKYPPYEHPDWATVLDRLPLAAEADWREATAAWQARDTSAAVDTTFAEWSLTLIGRMRDAGVPIGAGTDTPIGRALPGFSLHTELERLVEAGLSPLEAIESATVRPAEFLSLTDHMGAVAPDMVADLVLLDENPLDDIRNTRSVYRVVSKGQVLDPRRLLENL